MKVAFRRELSRLPVPEATCVYEWGIPGTIGAKHNLWRTSPIVERGGHTETMGAVS